MRASEATVRIALDITPALRQTAGVGRYTLELARALIDRAAFDYLLFAGDRPNTQDRARAAALFGPSGTALRWGGIPARWQTRLWYRLGVGPSPERRTGRVALWHSPDFLVPPLRHARAVVTVHDLSFLVHPERADPALARFLDRAVPRAVGRAAQVLADSAHTAKDLTDYLKVPPERITVAYPGVGPEFGPEQAPEQLAAVRERLGLDRPYILGVGTLEPRKDWPLLMAAFTAAGPALAGHDLVLAGGEGWGVAPILAAAAEAGPRVRLLGFVPDAELPALMRLADAFAYPSVYEGFGLPPLEAMACATPTLVSDASCLPEVVGDAALVLPVGDLRAWAEGLVAAVGDTALRNRLAADGPRRAARFTWADCAATVEQVFRRSIPPGRPH